jgi:hypothetical protein
MRGCIKAKYQTYQGGYADYKPAGKTFEGKVKQKKSKYDI